MGIRRCRRGCDLGRLVAERCEESSRTIMKRVKFGARCLSFCLPVASGLRCKRNRRGIFPVC
jgi:hypothetical protein